MKKGKWEREVFLKKRKGQNKKSKKVYIKKRLEKFHLTSPTFFLKPRFDILELKDLSNKKSNREIYQHFALIRLGYGEV